MEQNSDFPQQLNELAIKISESYAELSKQVPSPLFHYTSAEGLIGILQNKCLWLTDLRYMNDLSELQYSRDLLSSCLEQHQRLADLSRAQNEFLSRVSQSFFDGVKSVYSASFCENGNLLSQWRAYRGRGGGYALGIDFFHTLRLLDKACVLRKVVYKLEQQTELINSTIAKFLEYIKHLGAAHAEDVVISDLHKVCRAFSYAIREFIFTFKHPDFHEEREWRLVHFADVDPRFNRGGEIPKFRTYEGNVIPYFSVGFDHAIAASCDDTSGIGFPFSTLVIGPTINGQLNQDSITTLLLSLNPDVEPKIEKSEIPLRWL